MSDRQGNPVWSIYDARHHIDGVVRFPTERHQLRYRLRDPVLGILLQKWERGMILMKRTVGSRLK